MFSKGAATAIAVLSLEPKDLIDQIYEADDCWIFVYSANGSKRGGSAVMVDKMTGVLHRFALPDSKNYQRLANAKMLLPRR